MPLRISKFAPMSLGCVKDLTRAVELRYLFEPYRFPSFLKKGSQVRILPLTPVFLDTYRPPSNKSMWSAVCGLCGLPKAPIAPSRKKGFHHGLYAPKESSLRLHLAPRASATAPATSDATP